MGLAGTAEKCRWVVEDLGFDALADLFSGGNVGATLVRVNPPIGSASRGPVWQGRVVRGLAGAS